MAFSDGIPPKRAKQLSDQIHYQEIFVGEAVEEGRQHPALGDEPVSEVRRPDGGTRGSHFCYYYSSVSWMWSSC